MANHQISITLIFLEFCQNTEKISKNELFKHLKALIGAWNICICFSILLRILMNVVILARGKKYYLSLVFC